MLELILNSTKEFKISLSSLALAKIISLFVIGAICFSKTSVAIVLLLLYAVLIMVSLIYGFIDYRNLKEK